MNCNPQMIPNSEEHSKPLRASLLFDSLRLEGGMGQQKPYVVQKGQIPSPACGEEEPLAMKQTGCLGSICAKKT